MVLSLTIQSESSGTLALEATQAGKISMTLVWIKDRSQTVWVIAQVEMVLDQLVEGMVLDQLVEGMVLDQLVEEMVLDQLVEEMVLDQLVEEIALDGVDYWMRAPVECILISTDLTRWGVA